MSRAPAVSVLMTSYNRERYIAAAIESVLSQRFPDFELVITDNCSTDGTLAIAQRYAAIDPRIRLTVNERNLGQFGNRNRAASLARGRYLKYHDSDDLMYPHCLEMMVPLLEQHPAAGFALSAARPWSGGPVPMLLSPQQAYEREYLGFGLFMGGPACGLYRAETFGALGGFPEEGVFSDHLFLMKACAHYPVLLVPADLFWYRLHEGQEFASKNVAQEYARLPGYVWRMLSSDENPLSPTQTEAARHTFAWNVAKQTWRDLRARRLALAAYRLRHTGLTVADWARYFRRPSRSALAGTPVSSDGEALTPDWVRLPGRR
ncbi:MAG TPA: glycosyltransferase family 2 protein [Vicinamibacterales bacterium]|nr:glycosyltransferase family 2 protein [Vicinamibacterales bacterium]